MRLRSRRAPRPGIADGRGRTSRIRVVSAATRASPSSKPAVRNPAATTGASRSSSYHAALVAVGSPGTGSPRTGQGRPREDRPSVAIVQTGPSPLEARRDPIPGPPGEDGDPCGVDRRPGRRRDRGVELGEPPLERVEVHRGRSPGQDGPRGVALEDRPQRRVDRLELQVVLQRLERRDAAAAELLRESPPPTRRSIGDLTELPEDVTLVGVEVDPEAVRMDLVARPDVGQPGPRVAERDEDRGIVRQAQPLGEGPSDHPFRAVGLLARGRHRPMDRAARRPEAVVEQHERPGRAAAVRIGQDMLIDRARRRS